MVNEVGTTIAPPEGLLFTLKDTAYTPITPRMNEPFTVKGKIQLFKIPFIGPIWVIVTVTYPETWWEEIIPIWGSPERREDTTALGGNFEVTYAKGFDREGEYKLAVRAYAGPTLPLDSFTLPPFPPVATEETTFTVMGEVPPVKKAFDILEVTVNERTATNKVTATDFDFNTPILMTTADKLNVNFKFQWIGIAKKVTVSVRAGRKGILPWDFVEATDYFTATVDLPEASELEPFIGTLAQPIVVPLTKCGGLTDGAIEIKVDDYIGRVWNVYATKVAVSDIGPLDRFEVVKGTYNLGDTVNWDLPYTYKGKAQGGKLTISLGTGIIGTFSTKYTFAPIPWQFDEAMDWAEFHESGYITLPTTLERGQTYSVRARLETADGVQETDTDWSAITIGPGPPTSDIKNFDFQPQKGTYDLGASVPYTAPYEYKGKAQGGKLIISLGTGVAPSFFTAHTYSPISVSFSQAMDWTSGQLTGSFTLPTTLQAGQTYSVRARLETADGKQETDTDWGVITIKAAPTPPKADIKNFDFKATAGTYAIGAKVPFTAPYEYKGKAQSGRLTISLGTGVYPSFFTKHTFSPVSISFAESMDWQSGTISGNITLPSTLEPGQTYSVRAKLEAITDYAQETDTDWGVITVRGYTLTIDVSPKGGGSVTKSPNKATYSPGEKVTLTASPSSGYEFDHWAGDASGTSPTTSLNMNSDKFVVTVFREIAPPVGISFSVRLTNIPSWLMPVYEWYLIWRGISYGKWTGVSYSISLKNVLATGSMSVVLKHDTTTHTFTTVTYALKDGMAYKFNVEKVILE